MAEKIIRSTLDKFPQGLNYSPQREILEVLHEDAQRSYLKHLFWIKIVSGIVKGLSYGWTLWVVSELLTKLCGA